MATMTSIQDVPVIVGGRPAKTTAFGKEDRYGEEELRELKEALSQQTLFYAHGKKVKQLEEEFAAQGRFKFGIAASSGTAAIHAAVIAAGISPGDEVIVPPITDIGSILPILYQSAVPVFADLDPRTYNLDPDSVEQSITDKTRAIIVVHLAGNACDMTALAEIAERRGIKIIEDCAQAHGCTYRGKLVGHFGVAGCFSFNEFKHIGCGDGGIIVTNEELFSKRLRLATDKGYSRDLRVTIRHPAFLANNYRMTELQGAVARAQIRKLESIIQRRRRWCGELTRRLGQLEGVYLPKVTPGCEHSYWFYMMRVDEAELGVGAEEFAQALQAEGLPANAHYIRQAVYEYPLFTGHSAFDHAGHPFALREYGKGLCPNAEAILDSCVALAINEAYSQQDLDETVHGITRVARWFAQHKN